MFDFLGMGKTLRDFAGEVQSIRVESEKLRRQVEDIEYAPLCKGDVLKALEIWAGDCSKQYRRHFEALIGAIRNQQKTEDVHAAITQLLRSREILPERSAGFPISRDMQLVGLLGLPGFMSLMKAQMDEMEWPASSLPMSEREAAMAPLRTRIKKLEELEAELVAGAEKAGLSVL